MGKTDLYCLVSLVYFPVDGSEEQGLKDGKDGIVSSPTVPSGKAVAKRKKLTNPSTQKKKKRMVIMSDSEDEGLYISKKWWLANGQAGNK